MIKALKNKDANIILLSDTRLSSEIESVVKSEWGGKAEFASFTSQARGVAVLFKKDFAIEIIEDSIYRDGSGNFVVLNAKYESFTITLACIYGPNSDEPKFYERIVFDHLQRCQESSDFCIVNYSPNSACTEGFWRN